MTYINRGAGSVPLPPEPFATNDCETYSEAGHVWNPTTCAWDKMKGATRKGIQAVGTAAYCMHPTTELFIWSYRLPWWAPGYVKRWFPGEPPPSDLMLYVSRGGVMVAHNAAFERYMWPKHWPEQPSIQQWRCSSATARVFNLPGSLDELGKVLDLPIKKGTEGKRLIRKFCVPRKPTKKDPRLRILPRDDPIDAELFWQYCDDDVRVEELAYSVIPTMTPAELEYWLHDQDINDRGVELDMMGVNALAPIVDQVIAAADETVRDITGYSARQLSEIQKWLAEAHGIVATELDADSIDKILDVPELPDEVREVLEARQASSSASIKKIFGMQRCASGPTPRLRHSLIHSNARTGRPTGSLVQPTNLPRNGPDIRWHNGAPYAASLDANPWGGDKAEKKPWHVDAIDHVISYAKNYSFVDFQRVFPQSLPTIAGCLRGLFIARDGYDLISSDYTAIEAVVAASLCNQTWRMDAFERGDDIYLVSISQMTGISLDEYRAYKKKHDSHHPDRQKGKVGELALGYGGGVMALRNFGAEGSTKELEEFKTEWRKKSSRIVDAWWELDKAFMNCILYPGSRFQVIGCTIYSVSNRVMIQLPSGRELAYHCPTVRPSERYEGRMEIVYWTYNTNPLQGRFGWIEMTTYGPKIFENIVQAVSNDILRAAIIRLQHAGYPVVLHVYDEIVSEVPKGWGSIDEFEANMVVPLPWARTAEGRLWPVKVGGGWRGRRYRK